MVCGFQYYGSPSFISSGHLLSCFLWMNNVEMVSVSLRGRSQKGRPAAPVPLLDYRRLIFWGQFANYGREKLRTRGPHGNHKPPVITGHYRAGTTTITTLHQQKTIDDGIISISDHNCQFQLQSSTGEDCFYNYMRLLVRPIMCLNLKCRNNQQLWQCSHHVPDLFFLLLPEGITAKCKGTGIIPVTGDIYDNVESTYSRINPAATHRNHK